MILTTDGRGEFILTAEEQNRYEEFASAAAAFATVSSTDAQSPGAGEFTLSYTYDDMMESWPEGVESRVLARSAHVYGKGRRIKDLKFDLENEFGPTIAVTPNDGMCDVRIRIRAITTAFDPETITWEWAYTQGQLGLSEGFADYLLGTGSGITQGAGLPSRGGTPFAEWNALEGIYGFEMRVEPMGTEREWLQALWRGRIGWPSQPVGYVILK